ncbi:spore germination protein [Paenibacillus sp. EKM211P]|uniref:spore germination protein n=1 Tax=Paenibacillus sp. EKM211P TaxID=1683679 RepID=UPI0013E914E6|nr:spore germination protein [Paenibacillus sp. EKM211P]KAF6582780.1 spore germination protein [Paenibacillus sp. EKM211P]
MVDKLKKWLFKQPSRSNSGTSPEPVNDEKSTDLSEKLSGTLKDNMTLLKQKIGHSTDFNLRCLNDEQGNPVLAVGFLQGLIDQQILTTLLEELTAGIRNGDVSDRNAETWLMGLIPIGGITCLENEQSLIHAVLYGQAVLLVEGCSKAYAASISGGAKRAVEEPTSQTVIRGPKEGFTEDISTNIALLRRRIKSTDLHIDSRIIGSYTQTKVSVAFIRGLADPEVVKEISRRLDSINTDSILESGYIEEFIQDGVWTPFPTIYNTERPDAVAGSLLEGLVAILVDGTPFVLIAPVAFFRFISSSEDYYQRYDLASFLRIVRMASFFLALLLPSFYIATTTFHQEMLPTTLLITLAAQRENTPFPALLEAMLMELTFEVIREAGVRMPRAVGPAISIVGALVLGQAAVQAGLVSAAMVIVVSFTAICNFVMPAINMAGSVRLLRFGLMLLAGLFGLYGVLSGLVPILVRLVSMNSFGIPYMVPIAPFYKSNMKDMLVRVPWWKMKKRPKMMGSSNQVRQATEQESFAEQAGEHGRDPMA